VSSRATISGKCEGESDKKESRDRTHSCVEGEGQSMKNECDRRRDS
jgi:hypothetical protein